MRNIKKVINEVINQFILNENINSLTQYTQRINNELNQIQNIDGLNQQLNQFVNNFIKYCVQIIYAVRRCVQANSLNENLSDWGLNLPPELGGNFWNDYTRGYYKTKNFFTPNNYGNANKKGNALKNVNQNTLPSVKLSELLRQLPQWENNCARYQIDQYIPNIGIIIQTIKGLQTEYNQLVQQQQNAQGQNP